MTRTTRIKHLLSGVLLALCSLSGYAAETASAPATASSASASASATPAEPKVYYIYNDHLNTPHAVTDSNNQVVWRNEGEPFGNSQVDEDVDGDGKKFELNLRFPGQYYDKETGRNQNYYRDYNPETGRYVQSDPIGLRGGMNTFAYVNGSPLIFSDPSGLCAKHPENPKCKTPIMQSKFTKIFGEMGAQLGIDPLFIMSSALQESGWNLAHVFGTNSSSNGQPLNNLFGMTRAGGNNIAYPTVSASAQAWIQNWGPYLSNNPQTIQEYASDLTGNPHHMYNANPAYPRELAARYKQLLKAVEDCGVSFDGK